LAGEEGVLMESLGKGDIMSVSKERIKDWKEKI